MSKFIFLIIHSGIYISNHHQNTQLKQIYINQITGNNNQKLLDVIINKLFVLNLDFKAGYEMANHKPEIRIYESGEGIFDPAHQKVKNDYVWNIDYDRAKEEGIV